MADITVRLISPLAGMIEGRYLPHVGETVDLPGHVVPDLVKREVVEVVTNDEKRTEETPETATAKRGPGRPPKAE